MRHLGNYSAGSVVRFTFNTRDSASALITLAGTPSLRCYKLGNTTETSTGLTLSVDYDSRTGFHHVAVDTSADGTFYATANDFAVLLHQGTVDGQSQAGAVLAEFSLGNRSTSLPANAIGSSQIADGAITSAKFTVASITGVASGILEKMAQLWGRFFIGCQRDQDGARMRTFQDDGTTPATTQTCADDENGNQSLGKASNA